MVNKNNIINAYCRIRTIDQTIPDDVLDFMKYASLEKLNEDNNINFSINEKQISEVDNQEIIEGNDIIAAYMNFIKKTYTGIEKIWCDEKHGLPVGELRFHSDWNWIIPVLKKISQIDDIAKSGVSHIMSKYNYEILDIWKIVVKHIQHNSR